MLIAPYKFQNSYYELMRKVTNFLKEEYSSHHKSFTSSSLVATYINIAYFFIALIFIHFVVSYKDANGKNNYF